MTLNAVGAGVGGGGGLSAVAEILSPSLPEGRDLDLRRDAINRFELHSKCKANISDV